MTTAIRCERCQTIDGVKPLATCQAWVRWTTPRKVRMAIDEFFPDWSCGVSSAGSFDGENYQISVLLTDPSGNKKRVVFRIEIEDVDG